MSEIKVPLSAEDRRFYETYLGGNVGAPVVLTLDDALVAALARIEVLEREFKDLAEPLGDRHDYDAQSVDEAVVDIAEEALKGSPEEAILRLKKRIKTEVCNEAIRRLQDPLWAGWESDSVLAALRDEE